MSLSPVVPFRPQKLRGAEIVANRTGAAGTVCGSMYIPPPSGALVTWTVTSGNAYAGLVAQADLGAFTLTPGASERITPFWPPPGGAFALSGTWITGDWNASLICGVSTQGNPHDDHVLVMPGNVWIVQNITVAGFMSWCVRVYEFASSDEYKRWNDGSVAPSDF